MAIVGTSVPRKEGSDKLRGLAKYIDDYAFPGCLRGVTLRSRIPHGRVKSVSFDPGFPWGDFVVATAKDIPGRNLVAAILDDQPLLADGEVTHAMQPILLIAHEDASTAYEALSHVKVDYEELPAVLSVEESLGLKQVLFAPDNVFKNCLIEKGDLEKAFSRADVVVTGEYRVPHQEQAYIENNGMAASFDKDGTLVAMGSMQCPYYVHRALKIAFNLPDEKVRVVQTVTGGGFGGKEDFPSMLAGHAALLALKAKRPVKMIYDRAEDMAATTKRHPAVVRHRTGVLRDGRLIAQDIDVVMDGGAYSTMSPVVLSRGALHATGPYECPNVRVRARAVATNTPPNGAFRGFGAPQTLFAAELQMERIAEALGMDSVELRRKNAVKAGSVTATGQVLRESVGALDVLERCLKRSRYAAKRRDYARWNKAESKPTWRGIGLALVYHGAGFTGSGEVMLASRAGVGLTKDGRIQVLAASTDMGQGSTTMFAQIAAETLGVPFDWVEVEVPDTSKVPNSGPTVASRTCMVVGRLIERAAGRLREELAKAGVPLKGKADLKKAAKLLCGGEPIRRFIVQYEKPKEIHWDEKTYKGDAYGVFAYAAVAVDLEIDKLTCEVRLRGVVTAQEIGKAINPVVVEGQIIGGTVQGLGWALLENPVYKNGVMQNSQLTNYVIPTFADTPPIKVELLEKPYSYGPFGAKGLGELPNDVPAPAVAAALHDATGHWFCELPILPEKILAALCDDQAHR